MVQTYRRMIFYPGQSAWFKPKVGKPLRCVISYELSPTSGKTLVRIGTDPFDSHVATNQLVKRDEMTEVTEPTEAAPRKRGRPRKDATVTPIETARTKRKVKPGTAKRTKPAAEAEPVEAPRRRGRPPKAAAEPVRKGPGRPRKVTAEAEAPVAPKKAATATRGRPKKVAAVAETPKRRGRPPTKAVATTKKGTAGTQTRKPAAKVKVTVTENPFRAGSNSHAFCAALMKGGTRRVMAQRLSQKVTVTPWSKEISAEDQITEIDTRLGLTAHKLKAEYGWTIERSGRGIDGKLKVHP